MMASVTKQPNGRYLVRFRTPAGDSRKRRFDWASDARRFAADIESAKAAGTFVDPRAGRITFEKCWDRWWTSTVNLRPSARARDESYARTHVLPRFGRYTLSSIDHLAVSEWIAELAASGRARPRPFTSATRFSRSACARPSRLG